jgi:hypothetical protein
MVYRSRERGDIVIKVREKEYPIEYVYLEQTLSSLHDSRSPHAYDILEGVDGTFIVGSHLDAEELQSLRKSIEYPNRFDLMIVFDDKKFRGLVVKAQHEGAKFEFEG